MTNPDSPNVPPAQHFGAHFSALVLVGFMGAGKTTTGRELARRLGWRFLDLDDLVEAREHRSIAEIFATSGEAAFRTAETQALQAVLEEIRTQPTILALGGGAFVQPCNAAAIRNFGFPVVFLDAPIEELRRRCLPRAKSRPLFAETEQFRLLYESRRQAYLQADFSVNTAAKSPSAVADELIASLHLNR